MTGTTPLLLEQGTPVISGQVQVRLGETCVAEVVDRPGCVEELIGEFFLGLGEDGEPYRSMCQP